MVILKIVCASCGLVLDDIGYEADDVYVGEGKIIARVRHSGCSADHHAHLTCGSLPSSQAVVNASAESISQTDPTPTQRG